MAPGKEWQEAGSQSQWESFFAVSTGDGKGKLTFATSVTLCVLSRVIRTWLSHQSHMVPMLHPKKAAKAPPRLSFLTSQVLPTYGRAITKPPAGTEGPNLTYLCSVY